MKRRLFALLPACLLFMASWAQGAPESQPALSLPVKNPKIIVSKGKRELTLYSGTDVLKSYPIALGFEPAGTKLKQGDGKTPEGQYKIVYKNPNSAFTLSLQVGYPNAEDAKRALDSGLIDAALKKKIDRAARNGTRPPQDTVLGGDIFIHGGGVGWNWTLGCIAMTNEDIKELFRAVPEGTPVQILP